MRHIEKWKLAALIVARASGDNPLVSAGVVFIFWMAANGLMELIETLIWGELFQHWGDFVVAILFIGFFGHTVWFCAMNKSRY